MATSAHDAQSSQGAGHVDLVVTSPTNDSEHLGDRQPLALRTRDVFTLEPLSEPSSSIRLLEYVQKGSGDSLEISLSAWKRTDAPPFNAISYAWGDATKSRSILVNGRAMRIRENCFYALWQARLYEPEKHVWIDSICINQSDLHEKGLQVQMMGSLYRQAALVLACIGPHADRSELILDLGKRLSQLEDGDLDGLTQQDRDRIKANRGTFGGRPSNARLQWVLSRTADEIVRLNRSMESFSARQYWRRVWIVQEISVAQTVSILCGTNSMPWEGLIRVRDTLGGMADTSHGLNKLDTSAIRNLHLAATGRIKTLQSFISHFRESKCADARDRLFAFGGLIDWTDATPITTDYTKSSFELAVGLSERLADSEDLLGALEVNADHVDMMEAVRRRQRTRNVQDSDRADSASRAGVVTIWKTNRMGELYTDTSGKLLMRTDGHYGSDSPSDEASNLKQAVCDVCDPVIAARLDRTNRVPKEILSSEGNVIGWACHEAQPGDLLIPCNETVVVFTTTTPYLLVLRHREGDDFDIVGQALLLADYRLPWHGRGYVPPGLPPPAVDGYSIVQLHISAEDRVVLVGQDLAPGRTHNVRARAERLFTNAAEYTGRAVSIVFHQYNEWEMMNVGASPDLQRSWT